MSSLKDDVLPNLPAIAEYVYGRDPKHGAPAAPPDRPSPFPDQTGWRQDRRPAPRQLRLDRIAKVRSLAPRAPKRDR